MQYFSHTARYLHSVKSVDTPAIGTFISASHAKMTPDPPIASIGDLSSDCLSLRDFPTAYSGLKNRQHHMNSINLASFQKLSKGNISHFLSPPPYVAKLDVSPLVLCNESWSYPPDLTVSNTRSYYTCIKTYHKHAHT